MRWLFWLALIAITLLALSPRPPAVADLGWDKLNHLAAFALLGLLARLAWPAQSLVRWLLSLLVYGGLLEIAQGLTPNRQAEWGDLLADALGLLLALGLSLGWERWQQARRAGAKAD
jgi:VanZ family protein